MLSHAGNDGRQRMPSFDVKNRSDDFPRVIASVLRLSTAFVPYPLRSTDATFFPYL